MRSRMRGANQNLMIGTPCAAAWPIIRSVRTSNGSEVSGSRNAREAITISLGKRAWSLRPMSSGVIATMRLTWYTRAASTSS